MFDYDFYNDLFLEEPNSLKCHSTSYYRLDDYTYTDDMDNECTVDFESEQRLFELLGI